MAEASLPFGSERGSRLSRREFARTVGTAALAASVPLSGQRRAVAAPAAPAETAVARFSKSLRDEQRKWICFPFDHPKRLHVTNNWAIVKPTIGDLSEEQQALCREIFKDLCSEEGHERFQRQMDDDYGGFARYHVAILGEPGTDKPFEWVLTGRHVTLRADGNSVDGPACGGPIFYGHAADGHFNHDPTHSTNVWWYPGQQARTIFATLDEAQRGRALVDNSAADQPRSIRRQGDDPGPPGLPVSTLDNSQKPMVQQLLRDLIRPFRAFNVYEIQECLQEAGGANKLRLTFFKNGTLGDDHVWDIWKLEGPAFAWYFHGTPHVHTWVNLARRLPRG